MTEEIKILKLFIKQKGGCGEVDCIYCPFNHGSTLLKNNQKCVELISTIPNYSLDEKTYKILMDKRYRIAINIVAGRKKKLEKILLSK